MYGTLHFYIAIHKKYSQISYANIFKNYFPVLFFKEKISVFYAEVIYFLKASKINSLPELF